MQRGFTDWVAKIAPGYDLSNSVVAQAHWHSKLYIWFVCPFIELYAEYTSAHSFTCYTINWILFM